MRRIGYWDARRAGPSRTWRQSTANVGSVNEADLTQNRPNDGEAQVTAFRVRAEAGDFIPSI